MNNKIQTPEKNELVEPIFCPHCKEPVLIEQLNCGIFRHGIIKKTLTQMNPHATIEECKHLFYNELIYGCGKPFKIEKNGNEIKVEICEYI